MAYNLRIRELPVTEQPRERLRDQGASALKDSELLAILLRVGVEGQNVVNLAEHILSEHGGWPGLQRMAFEDLCQIRGLGEAKTATLKAALEIGRRLLLAAPEERPRVNSPGDVANLLRFAKGSTTRIPCFYC